MPLVSLRVPQAVLDACDRKASACGLSRSEWLRCIVGAASGVSTLPEDLARVVEFRPIRDGQW